MSDVSVAMSEIVREGTWALRALGYKYGIAERAIGMVVWTEAVHGHALTLLRTGETSIIRTAGLPAPDWSMGADRVRRAAADGKCLLECGLPALDLATADARRFGVGRAVLQGVVGTRFASALASVAARRGLASVVVHAPGADEIAPALAAGWVYAAPTDAGPAFAAGELTDKLSDDLPAPLRIAAQDIASARDEDHGGFISITALPSPPAESPAEATDWPYRFAAAYRHGARVDHADYQHLYKLEMRTWAPTSERSRAQAGYGRY